MKINYIIATYSGIYNRRYSNQNLNINKKKIYLHTHLEILNFLSNKITQISIMKPKVNSEHIEIKDYYNFDNLIIDNIKDKIKIIDCENLGASYHQLLLNLYVNKDNFDYHIFTEDDYIPAQNYFDGILINMSNNTTNSISEYNYLCAGKINPTNYIHSRTLYKLDFEIADFSLGIFNKKTVQFIFQKINYSNIRNYFLKYAKSELHTFQIVFSKILFDCDIKIYDWCDIYLSLFYENKINEYFLLNYESCDWNIKRTYNIKDKKFLSPIFLPIEALYFLQDNIQSISDNYLIDNVLSDTYYKLCDYIK